MELLNSRPGQYPLLTPNSAKSTEMEHPIDEASQSFR